MPKLTTNNFLFLAIMDLVCNEIDFNFQEKEEKKREQKDTPQKQRFISL